MSSDRSLYQRLNDFALDDESAAYKFSDRLAKENGWTLAFAKGAIAEYKKFVYLAATSPTPVTPSDIIDEVWHLHLTYTRSYWDEMCGKILHKPLHHEPTRGGTSESAKHRDLYAATLESYRREFDEEPPATFWPTVAVSAREPRRASLRNAALGAGAIALSSAGVALAATASGKVDLGVDILVLSGLVAFVFIVVGASRGKRSKDGASNSDGGSTFIPGDSGHHGHGHSGGHDGGSSHGGHSGCTGGSDGGGGGGDGGGGGGCSGGGCSSS